MKLQHGKVERAPQEPRAKRHASGIVELWTERQPLDPEMLAAGADVIVIATALESRSVWEDGAIWTYTRARIERYVAGQIERGVAPWIRARGGIIGAVSQFVDGEPVLQKGWPALLFLARVPGPAYEVLAGAGGQFPLIPREDGRDGVSVITAPWLRLLGPVSGPITREPFGDASLDDIARTLAKAWAKYHKRS